MSVDSSTSWADSMPDDSFDEILQEICRAPPIEDLGSPAGPLAPGDLLGGVYRLQRVLGQGSFGQVWKCFDEGRERTVAVKALRFSLSDDRRVLRRFQREIRTAAGLLHPNIVAVLAAGDDGGAPWYAMEYYEGVPCNQAGLGLSGIVEVFDGLLSALATAHARGVVHRDLKPDNVLVRAEEDGADCRVLDFGLAQVLETTGSMTEVGTLLGTVFYMSPEQAAATPADIGPRSDLYTCGVMLYEVLAGELPFTGRPLTVLQDHLRKPPPPLVPKAGIDAPPALIELTMALLEKEYNNRPESAGEVREALADIAGIVGIGRTASAHGGPLEGELAEVHATVSALPRTPQEVAIHRLRQRPPAARATEQARLWSAVVDVTVKRSARVVALVGEPGTGKSALAQWLVEMVSEHTPTRMLRVGPVTDDIVTELADAIYGWARQPPLDVAGFRLWLDFAMAARLRNRRALPARHHRLASERSRFVTVPVMSSTEASTRAAMEDVIVNLRFSPGTMAVERWGSCVARVLSHLATTPDTRPLLIWFDGPTSAHAGLVEWLAFLREELASYPVILLTSIADADGLIENVADVVVPIGPMSPDGTRRVVAQLLPNPAPQLVQLVHSLSAGRAGRGRDLVLEWLDAGHVELSAGQSVYTGPPPEALAPDTILLPAAMTHEGRLRAALKALSHVRIAVDPAVVSALVEPESSVEALVSQGLVVSRRQDRIEWASEGHRQVAFHLDTGSDDGRARAVAVLLAAARLEMRRDGFYEAARCIGAATSLAVDAPSAVRLEIALARCVLAWCCQRPVALRHAIGEVDRIAELDGSLPEASVTSATFCAFVALLEGETTLARSGLIAARNAALLHGITHLEARARFGLALSAEVSVRRRALVDVLAAVRESPSDCWVAQLRSEVRRALHRL